MKLVANAFAVNLAFGVAIEDGLLTPVNRNAESKTLKQIAMLQDQMNRDQADFQKLKAERDAANRQASNDAQTR